MAWFSCKEYKKKKNREGNMLIAISRETCSCVHPSADQVSYKTALPGK